MKLMTYFFGLWIFMVFPTAHGVLPKKEANNLMKIKNYKVCPNHTDTVMQIKDLKAARVTKDNYILTATTIIKEDIPGPLFSRIKVQRCQENKGSDTCVHYMDQTFKDICKDLENENSKSYDFMKNVMNIPNPRCPLPKGVYQLKSKPYDAGDKGDKVSIAGRVWKMEMYFLQEDENGNKVPACCVNLDALVEPKPKKEKNRNWGVAKSDAE